MNQLENCQARYRSNTWMGRTRTDGPDEFEPTKCDCMYILEIHCLACYMLEIHLLDFLVKTIPTSNNIKLIKIYFSVPLE